MSESKRWRSERAVDTNPLRMAEPRPRIGAVGTTSGVSLREQDIPQSSVRRVKEICLHYVKKCSGNYVDNKAAARYVHQMADEVIGQLSGIIAQIRRYESEPELYQALLDDWEQHFPASLGAIGTPKAVAAALTKQADEIRKLTNDLEAVKSKHEADLLNITRSMEAQIVAYRNGIMNERKQLATSHSQTVHEFEAKISEMNSNHRKEKEEWEEKQKEEANKVKRSQERRLFQFQGQIKAIEQGFSTTEAQQRNQFEDIIAAKNEAIQALENQVRKLKEECAHKSGVLASPGGSDANSVVSLELDILDSEDEENEDDYEFDATEEESVDSDSTPLNDTVTMPQNQGTRSSFKPMLSQKQQKTQSVATKHKKVKSKHVNRLAEGDTIQGRVIESIMSNGPSSTPALQNKKQDSRNMSQKTMRSEPKESSNIKRNKKIHISGVIGEAVRRLKEDIRRMKAAKDVAEKQLLVVVDAVNQEKNENKTLLSRIRDLELLNEELRNSLRLFLEKDSQLKQADKLLVMNPMRIVAPTVLDRPHTWTKRK